MERLHLITTGIIQVVLKQEYPRERTRRYRPLTHSACPTCTNTEGTNVQPLENESVDSRQRVTVGITVPPEAGDGIVGQLQLSAHPEQHFAKRGSNGVVIIIILRRK